MKVTGVDVRIVSVPLRRPVVTPVHHITTIDDVLVTVETDEGLSGIGYLWTFGVARARVLAAMVQDLAAAVVGRDALARSQIRADLWRDTNFLGRTGVAMFAMSAIDTALWDIAGKAAGLPLFRLLGGVAQPVRAYAGGLFLSDGLDAIVSEARDYVRRGFRAMKMRAGARNWRDDVARVEAVRDAIGPDIVLMIDVVQGWTPDEAVRIGRELARFDPYWIEDPVPFDDVTGLAKVAAALDVPIAAGENDYGTLGFRRLIEAGAIDIAMPDLQRVGGVTGWMKAAALAEAWNLPATPHVFYEIAVHLVTAIPNGLYVEYVPWWDVLFSEPVPIVDGTVSPPVAPGLGLRFDEAAIDRYRVA